MADLDKETSRSFFDNINYKVVDDLRVTLRQGGKVSIASACFSIYAFNELKKQLEGIDELRFIFTAPSFVQERESKQRREFFIPRINRERTLYGSEFEVRLRNQLTQKAIAIECAMTSNGYILFSVRIERRHATLCSVALEERLNLWISVYVVGK